MTGTTQTNRLVRRMRTVAVITAPDRSAPPRPQRRRGARRAATAIALGFAVALGAQLGVGWAIGSGRLPLADPQYHDQLARLRAHHSFAPGRAEAPVTLLFLGSSRTYNAVDAGAAGAALTRDLGRPVDASNFAHSAAGPVTTAVYLRRLLRDGMKPDAAVIEVHPVFLAEQVSPPFETRWLNPLRLAPDELALARSLGLPMNEPGAHGPRGRLLAGYEYRAHLLDRYAPTFSTLPYRLGTVTDPHGFARVAEVPEPQRPRLRAQARTQYGPCWADFRPGGSGVRGLRDALETCRGAGVRAALLITPESTEFRSWYAEPGRALIAPVVGALAREFGVPLFDAREWLRDELIADGHHLTGSGADAFTERLVRDAVAPWLRAPAAGGVP